MKKKANRKSNILLALVFLAGLSLLLYPTVSNLYNTRQHSSIINQYQQQMQSENSETRTRMISQAREYNRQLLERSNPFVLNLEQQKRYEALLNLSGSGLMGYLEIPCIDISLPIYHGTEEDVLQRAVGHLEWSSLPVGGESSHCVVSGHRGLPTADLMTHIDRMRVGDRFYLHVLGETLEYQVDQINVVLPDDTSLLRVEEGRDLVTLLTCTPYGINSHRLLVRGTRVVNGQATVSLQQIPNEIEAVSMIYVLPVTLILVLAAMGILTAGGQMVAKKRKETKHHHDTEKTGE